MSRIFNEAVVRLFHYASRTIGPRLGLRMLVLGSIYVVILVAAFVLAYELRWDFDVLEEYREQRALLLAPIVLSQLLLLVSFGQFRAVLSYFGIHDFSCIVASTGSASVIMLGLWFFSDIGAAPPRGVILINFMLATGGLTTVRLALRLARHRTRTYNSREQRFERRVGIIGAGDMGSALANDLLTKRGFGLQPVAFFDDDPRKLGKRLHGVPIFGPIGRLSEFVQGLHISEVILTIPSAGPKRLKEVIDLAQRAGLKTSIVPSFTQLAMGDVQVDRFRPVELEDLLGRKEVDLDSSRIEELVHGRVVLVTGAGGSIGSELCRQIAMRGPRKLLLVEQSEVQLFQIEQELIDRGYASIAVPLIADVLDAPRLHEIFGTYRPEIVFHAAAHKHVFMMERQPAEAVKNNFVGTSRLAHTASEFGVGRFVLISTDKAINPTSVMGATKRLAEYAILGEQGRERNRTAFMAVRFGNVLGSSGSVIPIFKRQIAAGGPVTVTHPDVTRYFMTIPEAVGLVLQAGTMGQGGEVFVLDMGTPMRIVDVARQLIELSGFRPDVDIEIKFIGLRQGEKLYEELQHRGENLAETSHPRVMRLQSDPPTPEAVEKCLAELAGSVHAVDEDGIKELIKRWVPEYTPSEGGAGGAPKALEGGGDGRKRTEAAAAATTPTAEPPAEVAGLPAFPEESRVAQKAKALFRP